MAEITTVIWCNPADAQRVRAAAIELGHAEDVAIRSSTRIEKGEAYIDRSEWIAGIGCTHKYPEPLRLADDKTATPEA